MLSVRSPTPFFNLPFIDHLDSFLERQSFASAGEADTPGNVKHATRVLWVASLSAVLPFQEIVCLYPEAGDVFQQNKDQLNKIFDSEFRKIKDRICLAVKFVSRTKGLDRRLRTLVAETAAMEGYKAAKSAMESASKGTQGLMGVVKDLKAALLGTGDDKASLAQHALQEANREARNITDSQFFLEIIELDIIRKKERLGPSIERAKELAHKSLMVTVPGLVTKLVGLIKKVQEDVCRATVKAETISYKDEEQRKLRLQLICHVNGSTTQIQHP